MFANGYQKFKAYQVGSEFYAAEIMGSNHLPLNALTGHGTFHMILTHIVQKDPKYTEFYKNEKGLKLLDNSLFELGYALPPEQVIEAAELVNADILVSPDVIRNGPKTVENAKAFVKQLTELGKIDDYAIMAVPQGNTKEEWMECYTELCKIPQIDALGLSIIGMITAMQDETGTDDIVTNRVAFMNLLKEWEGLDDQRWHHLLGLGRGAAELNEYAGLHWVRSNDSSNAWWHGYNNIPYKPFGLLDEKLKLEVDFAAPIKPKVEEVIEFNLLTLRHIVKRINRKRGVK